MPSALVLDLKAQEPEPLDVNSEGIDPDAKEIDWLDGDAYAELIAAIGRTGRVRPPAKSCDARLSERVGPLLVA